ncbi:MAG TPA: DinB family protein [Acidimicrobiia bacterium]
MTNLANHERDELLRTLAERREFLRTTIAGMSTEQAGRQSTVSALCLGGLVKHVADTESAWIAFIEGGAAAIDAEAATQGDRDDSFRLLPGETVDGVLDRYRAVAERTEAVVRALVDLDESHPLPDAPWFPPATSWSARRVVLHLIGETAQHAGHADIIREAIDGAKTMG